MHIVNQRFLTAVKATGWAVEGAFSAFVAELDEMGVPYPNSFQSIYDKVQEHGVEALYDPMPMGLIDLFASVCKFSMEFVLFGRGQPDEETDVSTQNFDDFAEKSSVRAWVVLSSLSVSNAELAKVFGVSAGAVSQWRNQLCGMKPAHAISHRFSAQLEGFGFLVTPNTLNPVSELFVRLFLPEEARRTDRYIVHPK